MRRLPYLSCGTALTSKRRVRLDCCADATGKGRAILLVFLTIVNILYSQRRARYIKISKRLAGAITATVMIFDSGAAWAHHHVII